MTNTTSPAALVDLALQTAEAAYKKACDQLAFAASGGTHGYFDVRYVAEWDMKSMVKLQFNVEALTVAQASGFRAMTAVLANALAAPAASSDAFGRATVEARAEAARALVNGWRSQLDADVLLERL